MPDLDALLARAGMDKYLFNTAVVRNTDVSNGDMRVMVTSAFGNGWGDCIGVSWYLGGGAWQVAHFSPARARIIARHLLDQAERLEKNNGTAQIDYQPRKER